jgi:hypothetical protein
MAGYSGTPLPKKLGVGPGSRVSLVDAPPGLREVLAAVDPDWVATGPVDVVVLGVTQRSALTAALPALGERIRPAGAVWISWPKKASKLPTDITEDVIREKCLPLGLVDVKVCAIDEQWSGLKLVWRRERR